MREDIRTALIVDNNNARGMSIKKRLQAQDLAAVHLYQLEVHDLARGIMAGNFKMDAHLDRVDLLFIHLGYLQADLAANPGGNLGSMECLLDYRDMLKETCVVAYTGGARAAPPAFAHFRREAWHVHHGNVNMDTAFNIPALVAAWRRAPGRPPPLNMLVSPLRKPDFKTFISAYQRGSRPTLAEWRAMLGTDEQFQQLLDEMAAQSGAELQSLAQSIRLFLPLSDCHPDAALQFPANIHQAIQRADPWSPG